MEKLMFRMLKKKSYEKSTFVKLMIQVCRQVKHRHIKLKNKTTKSFFLIEHLDNFLENKKV